MTKRKRKKKYSIGKKVLLGFLSFICILVLVGSILIINLSSKINTVEIDRSFVTDTGKEPIKEEKDVITIALLGSDYSGTEIGASDATMILSIDTKKNNIKLLSLMRDIYLNLPDGGKKNLNYTLADGGPELLLKTINYNFNLQVDKFVHVSLHTLPIIIDKLGGVELEITNEELNFINGYINSIDSENGTITEPLYSAGRQLLNGTQAAAYCRIRYTEGRDYKRTERQRDVLSAIFDKFKNISFSEIPGLINDLLPLVSTNMTTSEMLSIATKALGTGVSNIEQGRFPLDEHHYAEWTDMYHMIVDIDATTEEIHKFIYSK
ncbi:LCP family protein [Clostridium sp. NSJ-145]|uniref:LCP family protein n=1 Tax=Clostridium sp. NSJ-145 TaxID=2897777 RepID=UPI001E48A430|nr:LCP family protein [Clostridium sp. NSJ-145]MCD2502350.1 LCP family protein [Clostridium sp. NSJ-145]